MSFAKFKYIYVLGYADRLVYCETLTEAETKMRLLLRKGNDKVVINKQKVKRV